MDALGAALLIMAGFAVAIFAHEAGHALSGNLCEVPVRLMSVGVGPRLFHWRMGETRVELRLLPLTGVAISYPALVYSRYRFALFVAGGALGNIALVALVAGAAVLVPMSKSMMDDLGFIVWPQLLVILMVAIPMRTRHGGSDGKKFWRVLFKTRDGVTQNGSTYFARLAIYNGGIAPQPNRSPASARVAYHLIRLDESVDVQVRREACDALRRELRRLPPAEEMLAIDAIVTQAVVHGEPYLRADLDVLSSRALQLGPKIRTLRGSRGAALIELGHDAAGMALLTSIGDGEVSLDSVMSRLFMARAERALGNVGKARHLLEAVRSTPGINLSAGMFAALLARVEAEIAAAG